MASANTKLIKIPLIDSNILMLNTKALLQHKSVVVLELNDYVF